MKRIMPYKLSKGDAIGLIAPAFRIQKLVAIKSKKLLERLGFQVKFGQHVSSKYGFLAGKDEERAADIAEMFENNEINAIFSIFGGAGCNRLLPLLDFKTIKKHPKIFLGMSDVSLLLNVIFQKTGLITFHGPNIGQLFISKEKQSSLFNFLVNGQIQKQINKFKIMKSGRAQGYLIGGNLEAISSLFGSQFQINWQNKIFFWEEIKEDSSEISRILMNYKLNNVFNKIKGMLIGQLYQCEPFYKMYPEDVVKDLTNEYFFPILSNLDFGHYCKNIILPIGVKAKIDTYKKTFEILESPIKE